MKSFLHLILSAAISLVLFTSCASLKKSGPSANQTLTREQAFDRSEIVSEVAYTLYVNLSADSETFNGKQVVDFALSNTQKDLPIDYHGKIKSLVINGNKKMAPTHTGVFLILPKEDLVTGRNHVEIEFESRFSTTGVGLHRFQDPADKNVYLYTQFEPFDANKMAPFFDQPDIKATLKLTVVAPANWEVISTTLPEKTNVAENKRTWEFKPTPRISTYIYSLHAGPYKVWKSKYKNIPLRLMARQSLAANVNPEEWFATTKHGLRFFPEYFDYAYPFEKYDQLIVPEFNFGAMENAGAVTFSERYVKRGHRGVTDKVALASVILHEMAHMWFGNLVTMKWWNDLWLNESFATYMAAIAVSEMPAYRDLAWIDFFDDKKWAYYEDQLVTTHPIEASVQNTDEAFSNFDGITYGKGAATMKQLSYFLSPKTFQDGVRSYFKSHAYKNTELTDFIGALASQTAKPEEVTAWSKAWLQTSGVERFQVGFTCSNDSLKSITVQAIDTSTVRPQATQLEFLHLENGKLLSKKSWPLKITAAKTVLSSDLKDQACPLAVALNGGDHGYLLQSWDQQQAKSLLPHIGKISDPLLRFQVWYDLREMVTRAKFKPQDYIQLGIWNLPSESSDHILKFQLYQLAGSGGSRSLFDLLPTDKRAQLPEFEALLWNEILRPNRSSDQRYLFFDALARSFSTPDVHKNMKALAVGKLKVPKLNLDADRKWSVLIRLCALGESDCSTLVEEQLKQDSSDRGKKFALAAQAAQPVNTVKEEYFQKLVDPKSKLSLEEKRQIMRSLFPYDQDGLKKLFTDRIYSQMKNDLAKQSGHFQEEFVQYLHPGFCDSDSVERLSDFQTSRRLSSIVERSLKTRTQEEERCVSIRQFSLGPDIQ